MKHPEITHHSLDRKPPNFFDSSWRSLLKRNPEDLYTKTIPATNQSSVPDINLFPPKVERKKVIVMDFIKPKYIARAGGRIIQHTRLWRWMVYSRATTSAMAERVAAGFLATLGWVLGVGAMVAREEEERWLVEGNMEEPFEGRCGTWLPKARKVTVGSTLLMGKLTGVCRGIFDSVGSLAIGLT